MNSTTLKNYVLYSLLKKGYDVFYTQSIVNCIRELVVMLLIDFILILLIQNYYPNFIKIAYAIYNFIHLCKIINFFTIYFPNHKRNSYVFLAVTFIRIFADNFIVDVLYYVGIGIYLLYHRNVIIIILKHSRKVIFSNLSYEIRIWLLIYLCVNLLFVFCL